MKNYSLIDTYVQTKWRELHHFPLLNNGKIIEENNEKRKQKKLINYWTQEILGLKILIIFPVICTRGRLKGHHLIWSIKVYINDSCLCLFSNTLLLLVLDYSSLKKKEMISSTPTTLFLINIQCLDQNILSYHFYSLVLHLSLLLFFFSVFYSLPCD